MDWICTPIEELENPNLKFATEIISDDGKMLGTWSLSKENRVFVGYDQLSPNLIHALIATEDERLQNIPALTPVRLSALW